MAYEIIEHGGKVFAEVIWAGTSVEKTRFFSHASSSFQFGLLAHETGFVEPAHVHHPVERRIGDLQQMFVVQRGVIAVDFFDAEGRKFREVALRSGDAINLVSGAHAVRVLETMQCISVKQGPFLGDELDKINVETR